MNKAVRLLLMMGLIAFATGCTETEKESPKKATDSVALNSLSDEEAAADCTDDSSDVVCAPKMSVMAAIQSNQGGIYLGGFKEFTSGNQARLHKLNANGNYDASFVLNHKNISAFTSSSISSIAHVAEQSDGKIVAVGSYVLSGVQMYFAARFASNGNVDSTFGTAGVVGENLGHIYSLTADVVTEPTKVIVLSNGKILILAETRGTFSTGNSGNHVTLIQLNSNGSVDTSFGTNGYVTINLTGARFSAYSLDVNSSGKILIGGSHLLLNNPVSEFDMSCAVMQHNSDGSVDTTFGSNGLVALKATYASTIKTSCKKATYQADGKIVLSGSYDNYVSGSHNYNALMVRLTSLGALDSSFGSGGMSLLASAGSFNSSSYGEFNLLSSGDILVLHNSSMDGYSIRKMASDGTLDSSYGTSGKTPVSSTKTGFIPLSLLAHSATDFWLIGPTGDANLPELLKF